MSNIKLGDFLDLVRENFEERKYNIHLYTVEGSNVDYQGEMSSFYSYLLMPFKDFELDSVDFQVDYEEGETYIQIYLKFEMDKFVHMEWVDKME